ncbi:NAD(P)-binding protein [Terfezia boudieri ATCC MYA-4762]|uniref:NAD(P)-binding protein n=1 Tax=Terfezia boudieri ATCC MYA-4762 TaxID=1051890 RepID=A0A3N4LD56_9PEZI|nr:NAD(P)-binding protein [Terfezia boudieri ATCC MYA-4762]
MDNKATLNIKCIILCCYICVGELYYTPSEYLIRTHASALNFFDILQVQGLYQQQPPFPWLSGAEFSGTAAATPTDHSDTRFQPGDRVFGAAQGAYAELISCPGASLLPVPNGWSFEDAAGMYVTAPTSYAALVTRAKILPGEWILVHAAAGGVGLSAIQVAKAKGAIVAKAFGADYAVDYMDKEWQGNVLDILKANKRTGVDVMFDPAGMVNPSLKVVAWNARILVVGFAGGVIEEIKVNKVLLKHVSVMGIHWTMYLRFEPGTVEDVWRGLFELINQGKFRPTVYTDKEYVGLESALGSRETWGKVVVKVPVEEELAKL